MKYPSLDTKGLKLWAIANAQTGALRMRAVPGTFDDWQAKIYATKKIALRYAWRDEVVIPIDLAEREGRKEHGK